MPFGQVVILEMLFILFYITPSSKMLDALIKDVRASIVDVANVQNVLYNF